MSNHHFHWSAEPFTILLFHFHSVPGRGFLHVGPPILHVRRTPAFSRGFFASRTAFFACRLTFLHVGQTEPPVNKDSQGLQKPLRLPKAPPLPKSRGDGSPFNRGPPSRPQYPTVLLLQTTKKGPLILGSLKSCQAHDLGPLQDHAATVQRRLHPASCELRPVPDSKAPSM